MRLSLHNVYYPTLCLVLAGCPAPQAVPDAGVVDAGSVVVDAGPPPVIDAGPPPGPVMLELTITTDGGLVEDEIDPVQQLDVHIPALLKDYRLRVFDDGDRVVPSDDTARETDGGIDYGIVFTEPLKTGRKYRLTVEAQRGDVIDDHYKDAERELKVRGEVEKPANAKKKPSKRK